MEEKMNRKQKNILEKIVQMTSLQIDIDELLADDNTDHGVEAELDGNEAEGAT
uniref:Uncharacterized protein n=1 Tax=Daucus carota subsp. sativus TaxID=79200 RepID=A0A161ZTT3_DAUCS